MNKSLYYVGILLVLCFHIQCIKTSGKNCSKELANDSLKLRFVNVLFRHGDRMLDKENGETYPNDPHKNFNSYPDGAGQLINVGKNRAYQLGQLLREKYNCFLGDVYYQPNVYARSTEFIRCKTTLQLVLAGLYPPTKIQEWNPALSWQPVDIIYNPLSQDALLLPFSCNAYKQAYASALQTLPVIKEIRRFNDLMKEMSKHTGRDVNSMDDLWILHQTLVIQSYLNLPMPKWSEKPLLRERLLKATIEQMKIRNYNHELIRSNGGVLLHRMIEDMKGVINGSLEQRKINIFSGHDINVVALLHALGIYKDHLPGFTSGVIIELYEKSNEYFVKVLHYLGIPSKMIEMTIPGCNVLCPLDKFVQLRSVTTAAGEDPTCQQGDKDKQMFKFLKKN